jgi:t-SNARE complex subunit (syntaxin)
MPSKEVARQRARMKERRKTKKRIEKSLREQQQKAVQLDNVLKELSSAQLDDVRCISQDIEECRKYVNDELETYERSPLFKFFKRIRVSDIMKMYIMLFIFFMIAQYVVNLDKVNELGLVDNVSAAASSIFTSNVFNLVFPLAIVSFATILVTKLFLDFKL